MMQLTRRWSGMTRPIAARVVAAGSALLTGLIVCLPSARSAERVVLTYGPFSQSVSVEELREFADTKEASSSLRFLAAVSNQELDVIHQVFTQEVRLNLRFLDRVLNSLPGEYLLFQTGQIFRTRSDQANIQALRAAFILSASDDNNVSIIEFLENYPVPEMYVEGRRFVRDLRNVRSFVERTEERLSPQLAIAQEILQGLICDCDAQASAGAEASASERSAASSPVSAPAAESREDDSATSTLEASISEEAVA